MKTYNWEFGPFACKVQEGQYENVVISLQWQYYRIEGEHSAVLFGEQTFVLDPAQETFVPFHDLTPAIVEGWMVSTLGEETIAMMQEKLDQEIESKIHPTVTVNSAPWT
jgi:hypothetical protein